MKEDTNAFLRVEKGRVEGYRESEEIPLSTHVVVVGRPPRSDGPDVENPDIKIRDDYVSRDQVKIYYSHDKKCFMIQEPDSGTRNGTFLNGEQIKSGKPYSLKDGDIIGLAKVGSEYRVILRFRGSEITLPGTDRKEKPPAKGLHVDPLARRVWASGKEVLLRKKEFELLVFLYQNRGKACSKNEIAANVWAEESGIVSEETIDQNIHRIRRQIEPDPSNPRYVKTIHNYGYRLDA